MTNWQWGILAVVVTGGYLLYTQYEVSEAEKQAARELKASVTATIENERDACLDRSRPVQLTIHNRSDRVLKRASVKLQVYSKGDSQDLAPRRPLEVTAIVEAHQDAPLCAALNLESPAPVGIPLIIRAHVQDVEFYERGAIIPR